MSRRDYATPERYRAAVKGCATPTTSTTIPASIRVARAFAPASCSTTDLPRWAVFNLVGMVGMVVQLAVVAFLVHVFAWHYAIATALGVEAAILHNFLWHQRWTWRDRPSPSRRTTLFRLAHFHLLNGSVSMVGNLAVTALCTGVAGLNAVASNAIAIVACSLVNFVASDALVFAAAGRQRSRRRSWRWLSTPLVMVCVLNIASTADAGPASSTTIAGWRTYETQVDAGYAAAAAATGDRFFVLDRDRLAPGWRAEVLRGGAIAVKIEAPPVPDGRIHHWIGAIFVPGITVNALVQRLEQRAGHESENYEDVLASRLIERADDRVRVFMKLQRTTLITVTYNTEHAVEYRKLGAGRATARSVATKIAELADAGTPREREKSPSEDNGFLWRLNAYWRYQEVPGGVIVECESVSLSRPVPLLVRPVANPIVDRIARESLNRTLLSLRSVLTSRS